MTTRVTYEPTDGRWTYVMSCLTKLYGLRVFTVPNAGTTLEDARDAFESARRRCPIVGHLETFEPDHETVAPEAER